MEITSSAFGDGETIPQKHGKKFEDVSPPLKISGVPEEAETLALIMDDPDAVEPAGKIWVHWTVWNIPADTKRLLEGKVPQAAEEGVTDFAETGYGGPAPPDGEHTYHFRLYALDTELDLPSGATRNELEEAMEGHVIAETELTGTFAPQ